MDGSGCDVKVPVQQPALAVQPGNSPVSIQRAENGYIVNVGCKNFVFVTMNEMVDGITLYFTDEQAARLKYLKQ
jgi:hypothetical protein